MKNLLKKIVSFFDKLLITPISRLIYNINKWLKSRTGFLEKALNKPVFLIFISLFIAIGIFFLINSKVVSLVETQAEVLSDQKVNLIYNEEAYVVEGAPNTVDITLIGRQSDLYLAKQLGDHEVTLNLTGYGVGEHKVKLSYTQTIDSINYKLDPSYVMVIIKEKQSTIKSLTYEILNQDKLNKKLSVGDIKMDRSEVVVKGSKEQLEKVATVKALVDLDNDALKDAGTYTLDNCRLVAYDENGVVIKNVEIVPSTTSVEITLESYSVSVPLKITTEGNASTGVAISSIESDVKNVTVYGDKKTIENLDSVKAVVNIDKLKDDKTVNVTIEKPAGVRYLSESTATITIKVGAEASKEINGIAIETKNLKSNLVANATSESDSTITVIAKGVQSVIDNVDTSKIKAYVDLSGYEAGTFNVPIVVISDDPKIQFVSKVKTVKLILSVK